MASTRNDTGNTDGPYSPVIPGELLESTTFRTTSPTPSSHTVTHLADIVDRVHDFESEWYSSEADIKIRSSDGIAFDVFSRILMEASPVFKGMVSLRPRNESIDVPVIEWTENAETVDALLRLIYPIPNPPIRSLSQLASLLVSAEKYALDGVIHTLRMFLVTPHFIERDPLRVYAIACSHGYLEEAKLASRACLGKDILLTELYDELDQISARDFVRLIQLQQNRGKAAIEILDSGVVTCPNCGMHGTAAMWWNEFRSKAKEELKARPNTERIFSPQFLAACVAEAARRCQGCPSSYVSPASQARLTSIREKIDSLVDTI